MDAPHANAAAGGTVTLTLTAEAHDRTRRTLLADTVELVEGVDERLSHLRDALYPSAIDVADAQSYVGELRRNLDALDALGWPEGTRP